MGFSIYNLFKAGLLVTNGVAVLHPRRFLQGYGLDRIDPHSDNALKNQIAGLLQAVGYLKVPLIAVNILVILIEIVAGG